MSSSSQVQEVANGNNVKNGVESESSEAPSKHQEETDVEVDVIEEEMNLEELMKQKELLQARLGACFDVESDEPKQPEVINLVDTDSDGKGTVNKRERLVFRCLELCRFPSFFYSSFKTSKDASQRQRPDRRRKEVDKSREREDRERERKRRGKSHQFIN